MEQLYYPGVVEKGDHGYGVYFPDLPGCVSAGETFEEAYAGGAEALALHLEGMREDGLEIPSPNVVGVLNASLPRPEGVARVVIFPVEGAQAGRERSVKANITMAETLLKRIDVAAPLVGLTRSSLLALAARQWLGANDPLRLAAPLDDIGVRCFVGATREGGSARKVRRQITALVPTRHG
ncbi:hypothetical protein BH09PSE1_BH09PSE1_17650 [soil metagenome]